MITPFSHQTSNFIFPGFTQGSVLFMGASSVIAQDNANFFWDDTNNFLGLGTASPAQELHVVGDQILTGVIFGGTAASDTLDLQSTSDTTRGFVDIADRLKIHTDAATYTSVGAINIVTYLDGAGITLSGSGNSIRGVLASGVLTWTTDPDALGMCSFFNFNATITNTGNRTFSAARIYADTSTTEAVVGTTVTAANHSSFFANPLLNQSGTISAVDWNMFHSVGRLTAGTLTNFRGLLIANPTIIVAAITNMIGVDIETMNAGATATISLRSSGTAAQMRHAGPAIFGDNVATTTSVCLEASFAATPLAFLTKPMTTANRDALTATNGMLIYSSSAAVHQAYQGGAWAHLPWAAYAPVSGGFTVLTEHFLNHVTRLVLASTERATLQGTARFVLAN